MQRVIAAGKQQVTTAFDETTRFPARRLQAGNRIGATVYPSRGGSSTDAAGPQGGLARRRPGLFMLQRMDGIEPRRTDGRPAGEDQVEQQRHGEREPAIFERPLR